MKWSKYRVSAWGPTFRLVDTRQELCKIYAEMLQEQRLVTDQENQTESLHTKPDEPGKHGQSNLVKPKSMLANMDWMSEEEPEIVE